MNTNEFLNKYPLSTFQKNQVIFTEGEKCTKIGIIIDGEIKISTITHLEKEETFTILKKNDIFGNSLIFSSNPYYLGDIIATTKATICFISKNDLIYELSNNKNLLEEYIRIISNKTIQVKQQNKLLAHKNIKDRILYFLSIEAKKQNSKIIKIKSVTAISQELSLPRPSVSRELKNLEDDNYIIRNKKTIKLLF